MNKIQSISIALLTVTSSHQRCSLAKGARISFAKCKGKDLCWSLFFNKVAGLRSAPLLKKRLKHKCFPLNSAKFLRAPLLQNVSRQLISDKRAVNHLLTVAPPLMTINYVQETISVTEYTAKKQEHCT